ncbi:MAG: NUDIX hydrolase [Pyrinomonadaceae bacterium]
MKRPVQPRSTPAGVPTLRQISAGGVVFRRSRERVEVVLILTSPERRWQLPKGLVDDGESREQAALREVREETGLDAVVAEPLQTVEYWYYATRDGRRVRYHKSVHFFLMEYVSGDVADHDHEVLEARWVDIDAAVSMLAFDSERRLVEQARTMIAARRSDG